MIFSSFRNHSNLVRVAHKPQYYLVYQTQFIRSPSSRDETQKRIAQGKRHKIGFSRSPRRDVSQSVSQSSIIVLSLYMDTK